MSEFQCTQIDCTIAVTGKCLLSHVPPQACPHLTLRRSESSSDQPSAATHNPVPTSTLGGNELGLQDASILFAQRYGYLIGLLGATGTGKTCLLSSLYLLASCGELRPTYAFAGSLTLPGFESRLRLLRKWDGSRLPDQIVDHTILADPRQPSLLHLRLLQKSPDRRLRDLFFTDLPGEWTTELEKRAGTADRLRFLQRADALLLAFPSQLLATPASRYVQLQSGRVLLQRLRDSVAIDTATKLVLIITRCDKTGTTVPPVIYQLEDVARNLGFNNVSHLPVASFSDRPDVPSGTGVVALLDSLLSDSWPRAPGAHLPRAPGPRMIEHYRYDRTAQ